MKWWCVTVAWQKSQRLSNPLKSFGTRPLHRWTNTPRHCGWIMLPQFWDTDWAGRSGHARRFQGFDSEVKQRESLTKDKTRHGKQHGERYGGTGEAHVCCVAPHATSLPLTWLLIIRSFTRQVTHRRPTANKPEASTSQPVKVGSDLLRSIPLSCFFNWDKNSGATERFHCNTYYYQLFVFSDSFLPQTYICIFGPLYVYRWF